MNKMLKKRIMIVVCIVSILVTSVSSLVAFGDKKAKAAYSLDVAIFQKYLNDNYGAKLAVDGRFGIKTSREAVKVVQRLYNEVYKTNLKVDGIMGINTVKAINSHEINKGARNKIVKFFQKAYNCLGREEGDGMIAEDGIFGSETERALDKTFFNDQDYSIDKICIRDWAWIILFNVNDYY